MADRSTQLRGKWVNQGRSGEQPNLEFQLLTEMNIEHQKERPVGSANLFIYGPDKVESESVNSEKIFKEEFEQGVLRETKPHLLEWILGKECPPLAHDVVVRKLCSIIESVLQKKPFCDHKAFKRVKMKGTAEVVFFQLHISKPYKVFPPACSDHCDTSTRVDSLVYIFSEKFRKRSLLHGHVGAILFPYMVGLLTPQKKNSIPVNFSYDFRIATFDVATLNDVSNQKEIIVNIFNHLSRDVDVYGKVTCVFKGSVQAGLLGPTFQNFCKDPSQIKATFQGYYGQDDCTPEALRRVKVYSTVDSDCTAAIEHYRFPVSEAEDTDRAVGQKKRDSSGIAKDGHHQGYELVSCRLTALLEKIGEKPCAKDKSKIGEKPCTKERSSSDLNASQVMSLCCQSMTEKPLQLPDGLKTPGGKPNNLSHLSVYAVDVELSEFPLLYEELESSAVNCLLPRGLLCGHRYVSIFSMF